MGLPTNGQIFNDDVRSTVPARARQLLFFAREVKILCDRIVEKIDGPKGFTGVNAVAFQNALQQVKDNLQGWPFGSLTSLEIRQAVADRPEFSYGGDAALVQSDIQAANANFNLLTAELANLIAIARAAGQIYDIDDATNLEVKPVLSSASVAALRALAVSVSASIG